VSAPGRLRSAASPLGLLILFAAVVRFLPGLAQPRVAQEDCETLTHASVKTLERCRAQRPDDVELLLMMGDRLEQSNEPKAAAAIYGEAARVDPRDAEVHLRLASVLLETGNAQDAAAQAQLALEIQPRSPAALALIARAGARK
jgi:predicted Zn-dependent protease